MQDRTYVWWVDHPPAVQYRVGRLLHSLARDSAVMNRAGHAKILPRQCDHVSGQTMVDYCLYCLYSVWLYCTSFRLWVHNNFHMFSYSECFVVFSRCRVDMKLETCRVPSSGYEQLRGRGNSNKRRKYRHFLRFEA